MGKVADSLITFSGHLTFVYFETLALEIYASKAGWEVVKPARAMGTSGVDHVFSFLASKDGHMCAIDLYKEVGQIEVLRTFLKEMDTKATVLLVCLSGRQSEEGAKLAKEYGFRILGPGDIQRMFETLEAEVSPEVNVLTS